MYFGIGIDSSRDPDPCGHTAPQASAIGCDRHIDPQSTPAGSMSMPYLIPLVA
jgi:hypothetical protein